MNRINKLLKTYQSSYVPGEKRSQKYNNTKRTENKLRQRLNILDQLINELPETSKINKDQKTLCRNLIITFNTDFKYLHRQAKDDTIILAFIFYQKKLEKPGLILQDYKICTKHELTTPIFLNICCRIANYYMVTSPINIRLTTSYDHELLIKNGGQ